MVRTSLSELVAIGVVARHGQGRAVSYEFDADHPLGASLLTLFTHEAERRVNIFDAIHDVATTFAPPPLGVWIYGSVARGEDQPGSDIDVAVCLDGDRVDPAMEDAIRQQLADVGDILRVHVSVIVLSLLDIQRMARGATSIWNGILTDALTVAGRAPTEIAAIARGRP